MNDAQTVMEQHDIRFNVKNPAARKRAIKQFHRENQRFPSQEGDLFERRLAASIVTYTYTKSPDFDPNFRQWYETRMRRNPTRRKSQILAFIEKYDRIPSRVSPDPLERQLYNNLHNYTTRAGFAYDEAFDKRIRAYGMGTHRKGLKMGPGRSALTQITRPIVL